MIDSDIGNELRLELRVKNNRLYNLIHSKYGDIPTLCRMENISPATVYNMVNLRKPIRKKDGSYVSAVRKIADIFNTYPEIIFPDDIYKIKRTKMIAEVPLSALKIEGKSMFYIEDHTENIMQEELKSTIETVLNTIPEREARIIKMRNGINCEPMTLREISLIEGVSRDRIRQIEGKGLRRLRNPKRLDQLKPYMENISNG